MRLSPRAQVLLIWISLKRLDSSIIKAHHMSMTRSFAACTSIEFMIPILTKNSCRYATRASQRLLTRSNQEFFQAVNSFVRWANIYKKTQKRRIRWCSLPTNTVFLSFVQHFQILLLGLDLCIINGIHPKLMFQLIQSKIFLN